MMKRKYVTKTSDCNKRLILPSYFPLRTHQEIIELLQSALASPSWPLKSQAARAVGTIAEKLPPEKMDAKNLKNLLTAVAVEGLAGRTWEGKEALLDATRQLCCRNSVRDT